MFAQAQQKFLYQRSRTYTVPENKKRTTDTVGIKKIVIHVQYLQVNTVNPLLFACEKFSLGFTRSLSLRIFLAPNQSLLYECNNQNGCGYGLVTYMLSRTS